MKSKRSLKPVYNFCLFYKLFSTQHLWHEIFSELADNGVPGCSQVVQIRSQKGAISGHFKAAIAVLARVWGYEAQRVIVALRKRFAKFGLELHTGKTRVISFGRFERERASREHRRVNTFDFLGFTHYCGENRKGKFILLFPRGDSLPSCKSLTTLLLKQ